MEIFDWIAPVYDRMSEIFIPDLEKYVFEKAELKREDRILDIGGGTGRFIDKLFMSEEDIEGYVLDRSKRMLIEVDPGIDVILGDASDLPFDPDTFDLVLCIDAFHHFEYKGESLDEMLRVVRSDGEVVILELEANHPLTRMIEIGERLLGESSRFYKKERFADVFLRNGFEVKIEKINFFQYILHAKKSVREQ